MMDPKKHNCLKYNFANHGIKTDTDGNLMSKSDTFHDMWAKNRGENIQSILKDIRVNWNGQLPDGYITKNMSGAAIGDIEVHGESFFEQDQTLPSLCSSKQYGKVTFDIKNIMDNYDDRIIGAGAGRHKGNTHITDILKNPLITSISITIPNGDADQKELFKKDKSQSKHVSYVANYIKYFFSHGDEYDDKKFLFSIDANCGPLPYIFQYIDNVGTLASALTICDSATGGVNEKKNKSSDKLKTYLQPSDIKFNKKHTIYFPFPSDNPTEYEIKSNILTTDIYRLFYKEGSLPFSIKNQSSIIFCVQIRATRIVLEAPFNLTSSGSAVSGASVPTLRKIIKFISDRQNILKVGITEPQKRTVVAEFKNMVTTSNLFDGQLDLSPIIIGLIERDQPFLNIINLLLDYKRAGDYEQVDSIGIIEGFEKDNTYIFCTGDRLCSVYGRKQKRHTVFSHSNTIDLFRAENRRLTPQQIIENEKANKITYLKNDINYLKDKITEIVVADIRPLLVKISNFYYKMADTLLLCKLVLQGIYSKITKFDNDYTIFYQKMIEIIESHDVGPFNKDKLTLLLTRIKNDDLNDEARFIEYRKIIDDINNNYNYLFKTIGDLKKGDIDRFPEFGGPILRTIPKIHMSFTFMDLEFENPLTVIKYLNEIEQYNGATNQRINEKKRGYFQNIIDDLKRILLIILDEIYKNINIENSTILKDPRIPPPTTIIKIVESISIQKNEDGFNKVKYSENIDTDNVRYDNLTMDTMSNKITKYYQDNIIEIPQLIVEGDVVPGLAEITGGYLGITIEDFKNILLNISEICLPVIESIISNYRIDIFCHYLFKSGDRDNYYKVKQIIDECFYEGDIDEIKDHEKVPIEIKRGGKIYFIRGKYFKNFKQREKTQFETMKSTKINIDNLLPYLFSLNKVIVDIDTIFNNIYAELSFLILINDYPTYDEKYNIQYILLFIFKILLSIDIDIENRHFVFLDDENIDNLDGFITEKLKKIYNFIKTGNILRNISSENTIENIFKKIKWIFVLFFAIFQNYIKLNNSKKDNIVNRYVSISNGYTDDLYKDLYYNADILNSINILISNTLIYQFEKFLGMPDERAGGKHKTKRRFLYKKKHTKKKKCSQKHTKKYIHNKKYKNTKKMISK